MPARRVNVRDGYISSDRSFGFVFSVVCLAAFLAPLFFDHGPRWWILLLSGVFLAVALVKPALLHGLNRAWGKFGLLLHSIVNPVLLGIIFYFVMTPTGLLLRLFAKDPLRLRFDPAAGSYWIKRDPAGPDPDSLPHQF